MLRDARMAAMAYRIAAFSSGGLTRLWADYSALVDGEFQFAFCASQTMAGRAVSTRMLHTLQMLILAHRLQLCTPLSAQPGTQRRTEQ